MITYLPWFFCALPHKSRWPNL